MNYIGIRGHRGAGKSSIAYLLGNTLELLGDNDFSILDSEMYDISYRRWCTDLLESENCVNRCSLSRVYFESFSDSIKTFILLILGCHEEYLYEDKYKDSIVVNLRDLSCRDLASFDPAPKLISAEDMYNSIKKEEDPQTISANTYMTLREFIMYFGLEVMQRFFGRNVWIKSLKINSSLYDKFYDSGDCYKIYIDLKTPAEATYIKQANGVIVNVIRPSHKKGKSGLDRLGGDDRVDYDVFVKGDLYSIKQDIINIAINITNKFKNGKRI